MDTDGERINRITETIIGCAFKVHNELMSGFSEKVYGGALAYELAEAGLSVLRQEPIVVRYRGVVAGEYIADLVVDHLVLVEIKAIKSLDDAHVAQRINYLAATAIPICLLLNFGRRVEVRRFRGPKAK